MSLERLVKDAVADSVRALPREMGRLGEFFLEDMSANGWRNDLYFNARDYLVDNFNQLADRIDPRQRMRDEELAVRITDEYIMLYMAYVYSEDKGITDELSNDQYNKLCRLADRFEDTYLANSPRRSSGGFSRPVEASRHSGSRFEDRVSSDRIPNRYRREKPAEFDRYKSHYGDQNDRYAQNTRSDRPQSLTDLARAVAPKEPEPVPMTRTSHREEPEEYKRPAYSTSSGDDDNEPYTMRRMPEVSQGAYTEPVDIDSDDPFDYVDVTAADPYRKFTVRGEEWTLAACAPTLVEGFKEVAHFYDINTHLRYLVVGKNNEIREEILEMNEDTRYLRQEVLFDKQGVTKDRSKVVSITGSAITEVDNTPREENPLHRVIVRNQSQLHRIITATESTEPLLLSSDREAVTSALLTLDTMAPDTEVDYRNAWIRDVAVVSSDVADQEKYLDYLDASNNLSDMYARMMELDGKMDPNLHHKVNTRLSRFLDLSLRYQWQVPSKTGFNFVGHYPQFIDAFTKVVDAAKVKDFMIRSVHLIQLALCRLPADQVADSIGDMVTNTAATRAVVFLNASHIVSVNETSDRLGIGRQIANTTRGSIASSASVTGELCVALRSIFTAIPRVTEATKSVTPIRIVTKDSRVITIYPYNCRQADYVLSEPVDLS